MASRACKLGPFNRFPPVLGDTLSLGDGGPSRADEPINSRVSAPIVIVDEGDRQASVVHSNPLGITKRGRTFLFEESHDDPAQKRVGREQRPAPSRDADDTPEDAETWVTLTGAPPSLFGDVVYEALSSPWADGGTSSGLLLKGRLEATPAGSALLFGEWTGPGASVAAELSKRDLDAVAESATPGDFNAEAQRRKDARPETSFLGVSAPLRQVPAPANANANASEHRDRRRGRDRGRSAPAPKSDDEILFFSDDK
ncbi:MAG: hypothetical protein HYY84_05895 [Deltaproteobacteria bacterium]|nr:hypothetical protein [Deltaproteobacteria bacterium]